MGNSCCTSRESVDDGSSKPLSASLVQVPGKPLSNGPRVPAATKSAPWLLRLCCRRRACAPPVAEQNPAVAAKLHAAIVADVRCEFPDGAGDWVVDADAQRMLVATEGDDTLARKKLKQAVRWKKSTLDGWLDSEAGPRELEREVRPIALGKNRTPLIYLCAVHQVKGEVAAKHWAVVWQRTMAEAPPCAQMDFVIDCFGFQLLLNLNLGPMLRLAASLDSYFAERFNSIFILDMPAAAKFIWKAIRPLLPPKTREKIHFISRSSLDDMKLLYDTCHAVDMRSMLKELLTLNSEATLKTGRQQSHALTRAFLEKQIDLADPATSDASWIQSWGINS